jgi:hypothetical protein
VHGELIDLAAVEAFIAEGTSVLGKSTKRPDRS